MMMFFKPQVARLVAPNPMMALMGARRPFVKTMEERKEENDKKAFQDDIKYFLGKETFSMHDFHERVLHGLKQKSTFRLMVWGEDAEVKVLEGQNKICSAMYDDEKNDPKGLVTPDIKKEIAETVQMEPKDVTDVLQKYFQLMAFHNYLKQKKNRGEPIPESRDELMQMYRVEKPAFLIPRQHKKSYNRAQIRYTMRRHHT